MSNSMSLQKNSFRPQFKKVMDELTNKFTYGNCTLGQHKGQGSISMLCIEGPNQNNTIIKGGEIDFFPYNEQYAMTPQIEIDCLVNGYTKVLNNCSSSEVFELDPDLRLFDDYKNNLTITFNTHVNGPCVGNFIVNSTIDLPGLSTYGCPNIPPMPITNSDPWLIVGFVVLGVAIIGGMTIIDRWKNDSKIANSVGGVFQAGYTRVKGTFTSGHVDNEDASLNQNLLASQTEVPNPIHNEGKFTPV